MNRNIFQIIYPFLDKLSLGRTLRNIIYWLWKISALVYGIFALYLIFQILNSAHDFGKFLLGIIACILIVLSWWIIAQIYFYRADKVRKLDDSDFTVVLIIAQMLRLSGEVIAAALVIAAVLVALVGSYFAGSFLNLLPYMGNNFGFGSNSIVSLLLIIVVAIVYAFGVLIIFYFLAELVSVGVTIAHNSIAIREMLLKGAVNSAHNKEAFPEQSIIEEVKPVELRCDKCDHIVSADDAFCMNCGNKLK